MRNLVHLAAFVSEGYDPTERAYQLACKRCGKPSTLEFELACGKDSPAVNPIGDIRNEKIRYGHKD